MILQLIVRAAKELQLRVRCVGSSHSWSPLFTDNGHICMYMGDLKPENDQPKIKLNKVTEFIFLVFHSI